MAIETRYAANFDLHQTLLTGDLQLRPEIIELFEKLQKDGTAIILTTTGKGPHVQDILGATGIQKYFSYVFEGSEIDVGSGKNYRRVATQLGFTDDQARDRMIAIGDLETDRPTSSLPLVFIHQPGGSQSDALIIDRLIQHLLEAGKGSFIRGFYQIKSEQKTPMRLPGSRDFIPGTILDGISVALFLQDPTEGGRKTVRDFTPGIPIPTMRVVNATNFQRNLQ